MGERFKVIIDVHAFIIKTGKILLLRRQNTGYEDGKFHVPAGHLEEGEKIIDALIREVREEIGIHIKPSRVKLAHVMHHKSNNERVGFFFEIKKWKGDIRNMEPKKCSEIRWFDVEKLPLLIVPYAKKALEYYRKKIIFSHYGW